MGLNVIGEDGRPRRLTKVSQGWTYVLTHFGTGGRGAVFDGRYDLSPGALYELQRQAIT